MYYVFSLCTTGPGQQVFISMSGSFVVIDNDVFTCRHLLMDYAEVSPEFLMRPASSRAESERGVQKCGGGAALGVT